MRRAFAGSEKKTAAAKIGRLRRGGTSPAKVMKKLLETPHSLRIAVQAVGAVAVLYALASVALAACGAVPMAPVLVSISTDNYYFWQAIFVIPLTFLAWVAVSGMIRLLLRRGPGCASLDKTAALSGVALAAVLFVAWLPSALSAVLMVLGMGQEELADLLSQPGLWQAFDIACYVAAAVGAALLLTLASRFSERRAKVRAAAAGTAAAAVLAALFVLFIR
jgi:hypothetical protein